MHKSGFNSLRSEDTTISDGTLEKKVRGHLEEDPDADDDDDDGVRRISLRERAHYITLTITTTLSLFTTILPQNCNSQQL